VRRPVSAPDVADFTDPYLDPLTGILRNLTGATTAAELDVDEAELAHARAIQLGQSPVPVTGDMARLQRIHRHLFQDVYGWAGELRTVDISKPGSAPFLPVSLLWRGAEFAFGELADENLLRGLERPRFVVRLAHHYDQVNHLHPFREGNGRTQRVFWSQLADAAGYTIAWMRIPGAVNDAACKAAAEAGDLGPLRQMFETAVVTGTGEEVWRAVDALHRARRDFPSPSADSGPGLFARPSDVRPGRPSRRSLDPERDR